MARLTRAATGQSAADVDGALRQARSAARADDREVTVADVLVSLKQDPEDENPVRDHRIALHECGHAIVGTCLGVGRVERLALTRQGGLRRALNESLLPELEAELAYSLAGRAAERLVLGDAAAGAGGDATSDLAHATKAAVRIDTHSGLGAEGLVWLDMPTAMYLRDQDNAARARKRLDEAENHAMRILGTHRDLLIEMAADLERMGILEGAALEVWASRIRASEKQGTLEANRDVTEVTRAPVPNG